MEETTSSMGAPPDSGIEPTSGAEPEESGMKWWVWALIGIGALVLILFIVGLFNQDAETAPAPSTDDSWTRVQTSGRLRVGTSADYPPFEYYNEQAAIDGFDMALIREIGNKLEVQTEISDFAFASLPDTLRIGQIDVAMAALSITPEREALADFSNIYYVGEDGILANQIHPHVVGLAGLNLTHDSSWLATHLGSRCISADISCKVSGGPGAGTSVTQSPALLEILSRLKNGRIIQVIRVVIEVSNDLRTVHTGFRSRCRSGGRDNLVWRQVQVFLRKSVDHSLILELNQGLVDAAN